MPSQQLIMHKITKIAGRNLILIFPKKYYYDMKTDHVQLNPIIVDFKTIDIILVIYKALYSTYSPYPRKNTIPAIFSVLFAFLETLRCRTGTRRRRQMQTDSNKLLYNFKSISFVLDFTK